MEYLKLPGIDKPVSRLVQGTTMITGSAPAEEYALLDAVVELGGTVFDTAHHYGGGINERAFGRWFNERGNRDDLVIIGKGAHPIRGVSRVTPEAISADLYSSLDCLQTDYLDLYLLHRDDAAVPVGPIVEILNEHLAAGRIHAFGGSNWSHERIELANSYALERNLAPFVASSPNFSLAEQVYAPWPGCITITGAANEAARQYYRTSRLAVFAWSSLAGGFFTGRFQRDNLAGFSSEDDLACVHAYCYPQNFDRLDRAGAMAASKGVTVPQIALAYVLSQPGNIAALTGCRTPEEFALNVAALQVQLAAEERQWLEG